MAATLLCMWTGCKVRISRGRYCPKHSKIAWKQRNPDKEKGYKDQRRAAKAKVQSESISRSAVWLRDKGICHICKKKANWLNWHLDHVIPLSKGGPHTYANVRVSHPACNWKKGAKILSA